MKTIYNYFVSEKNTVFILAVAGAILFGGCKKNDKEINVSFIESKLTNESPQQWALPFFLAKDMCKVSALLVLASDHSFKYLDGGAGCDFNGTWNIQYTSNRAGQNFTLNLSYVYNQYSTQQSFVMKYNAEQDVFYVLDLDTQKLRVFAKYNLAP